MKLPLFPSDLRIQVTRDASTGGSNAANIPRCVATPQRQKGAVGYVATTSVKWVGKLQPATLPSRLPTLFLNVFSSPWRLIVPGKGPCSPAHHPPMLAG